MTDLHIPRIDLARAVTDALSRGRYVLMTDGAGRAKEITLDLKERPDDLFDREGVEHCDGYGPTDALSPAAQHIADQWRRGIRASDPEWTDPPTDDHGATVPPQGEVYRDAPIVGSDGPWAVREGGVRVYEFALQDCAFRSHGLKLADVTKGNAPNIQAWEEADWVHVYDRVTRERRTLKRPEPDQIERGLNDLAADLRGRPAGNPVNPSTADVKRLFKKVEDAADPMPPVGPLTSTERLKAGDVLRVIEGKVRWGYGLVTVVAIADRDHWQIYGRGDREIIGMFSPDEVAFVARPGVWMPWEGGENPVPGMRVKIKTLGKGDFDGRSETMMWDVRGESGYRITGFMVIDSPPATSDT